MTISNQDQKTLDFIEKAKIIHGDEYNYSKVSYVNNLTEVVITCSIHGDFKQLPKVHKRGGGCNICSSNRAGILKKQKASTEFKNKARKVHGDKYDYSKVKYDGVNNKIKIICSIHGEFLQTPANHLQGRGCLKCAGKYMNQEYFIEKAKVVHRDKYDYSKVEYVNNKTKVTIICPVHGEFSQAPSNHLSSQGCLKCSGHYMNTTLFIQKAKAVHGDKYNYSKVEYINNSTNIIVTCPKHGDFEIAPTSHTDKRVGCQKCRGLAIDTKTFIAKAREVHGDKYDYSKTIYNRSNKKVTIICSEHGEFEQTPNNHLNSKGCQKCRNVIFDTDSFIEKAREIHGDKYDYSKVRYVNNMTEVIITCAVHGDFEVKPAYHIGNKAGCQKCRNAIFDKNSFIKKAREIHGDKYDYSKVKYTNSQNKVTIICPEHGEFKQAPSSHAQGFGCKKCSTQERLKKQVILNKKSFLTKAREIHGDRYDYSKVEYINNSTDITIICKVHGEFSQAPANHLSSQGCPGCSGRFQKNFEDFHVKAREIHGDKYDYIKSSFINMKTKMKIICKKHGIFEKSPEKHISREQGCPKCSNNYMDQEYFIEQAREIHGDKYDYSKTSYKTAKRKVIITCKQHGDFKQAPDVHLRGSGCNKCVETIGEMSIRQWLEKNKIKYSKEVTAGKHFGDSLFVVDVKQTEYDFLLLKEKIIIEYDGEQHFFPVTFGGISLKKAYKNLSSVQKRDELKDELALNSGYKIIRIPFWERDNIEEILENSIVEKNSDIFTRYSLKQNRFRYEMIYEIGIKDENKWEEFLNQEGEDF